MLSVRLPETVERELTQYCAARHLTKSHVVQEALARYLVDAKEASPTRETPPPDLSFLAPDDPVRAFIGQVKDGPSTDEWMSITRGDDWNQT